MRIAGKETLNKRAVADTPPFFISVVIVNYNGQQHLERCLPALAAQSYTPFEIIVVDNDSTDRSVEWLTARYPAVRVVASPRNVGFAAGNNLGIRAARGEFIATLNNDTEPEPDYLEKLVAPMTEGRIGSCAPLMLQMTRRGYVDAAGIRVDRAGFAWNRAAGQPCARVPPSRAIFGACAGAALYRRVMLDEIGAFDEDYFGFYEDVDLAWRAQLAGWKCVFVPDARVYHLHGGSFRQGSYQKLFLLARNRWWTLLKNYPMPALALNFPIIVLADCAALFVSTAGHRSPAPLLGRIAAWRALPRILQKRRATQKLR